MIYESHVNVQCKHRMWFELSEEFEFKGGEILKVQAVRKETTAWLFCTLWSVAAFLLLSTESTYLSCPAGSIFRFSLSLSLDRTPNKKITYICEYVSNLDPPT